MTNDSFALPDFFWTLRVPNLQSDKLGHQRDVLAQSLKNWKLVRGIEHTSCRNDSQYVKQNALTLFDGLIYQFVLNIVQNLGSGPGEFCVNNLIQFGLRMMQNLHQNPSNLESAPRSLKLIIKDFINAIISTLKYDALF